MSIDVIGLLLGLALGQPDAAASWLTPEVAFRPRERSVSDWRWQAADNLDASPGTRAAILLGRDPGAVTRCVRLNNYWCIKRGGWAGEIAADGEGHVAFVSAAEGATVAALLLRRYYVDNARHSALAIVSHWAPASCGGGPVTSSSPVRGTLRARWLAGHGHRVAGLVRGRARASAVPDRLIGLAPSTPTIALGLGLAPENRLAPEGRLAPEVGLSSFATAAPARLAAAPAPQPEPACAADAVRIAHYAARAAAGIAASITADLGLFDAAGRPTPNLARLMRNMAAVEIGPLGAGQGLVEAAVAHAAEVVAARQAAAAAATGGAATGGAATGGAATGGAATGGAATGAAKPHHLDEGRRPEPRP